MTPVNYFIFGIAVGIVLVVLFLKRKGKGLIQRQAGEKAAHKQAILVTFANKQTLTNDELQALLGVSSATIVRYMDELESEGKVRQVGQTGVNAHYIRL